MDINKSKLVSSYLQYLPAIMQEDPFMGRFLLAFEKILSGVKDLLSNEKIIQGNSENVPGLEEIISQVETYFDPQETPEQFLPWLAGWVALSLRDDWEVKVKRDFIQKIVPLYQKRGTKEALTEMLKIYLQKQVTTDKKEYVKIFEFDQIPHYFQVQLRVDTQDLVEYDRKKAVARAIIDREKPAHTIYSLRILMPTMRLVSKTASPTQRLRLFNKNSQHPDYENHSNKTIIGTTSTPPSQSNPS